MANKIKGQISFTYEGKDYTVVHDMNAIAEIEEHANTSWQLIMGRFENGLQRIADLRRVLYFGLLPNHPEVTLEMAGDMLLAEEDIVGRLFEAAYPQPEPAKENASGNE